MTDGGPELDLDEIQALIDRANDLQRKAEIAMAQAREARQQAEQAMKGTLPRARPAQPPS
jgi:ElaB/YqjD/DUF883 family membrane-anchored ribosome-binding protein